MDIKKSFKVAMAMRGISQQELANRMSLSKTYVSLMVNMHKPFSMERLAAVCNIFDMKPSEFIALGETPDVSRETLTPEEISNKGID
jgi:DNA-binding Xre family transcriptional regulator